MARKVCIDDRREDERTMHGNARVRVAFAKLAMVAIIAVGACLALAPHPLAQTSDPAAAGVQPRASAQIVVGKAANVRANSIWFQEPDRLAQWQKLKREGNGAALASYEQEVLGSREAWQFTVQLDVRVLSYSEADQQATVELTTPGRLSGTEWFLDANAILE